MGNSILVRAIIAVIIIVVILILFKRSSNKGMKSEELQKGKESQAKKPGEDLVKQSVENKTEDKDAVRPKEKTTISDSSKEEKFVKRAEPGQMKQLTEEREDKVDGREQRKNAGKVIYQFLNQNLRAMYECYQGGHFEQFPGITFPEKSLQEAMDVVKDQIHEESKQLMAGFEDLYDIVEEDGIKVGKLKDYDKAKRWFENQMMPFYPAYYQIFGNEFKYQTFLAQPMLRLFHQLIGRRFRIGFHNRYKTGVDAFRYHEGRYQIFNADGEMLCDGAFQDGKMTDGFCQMIDEQASTDDWRVIRRGRIQDGAFLPDDVRFEYTKPVVG